MLKLEATIIKPKFVLRKFRADINNYRLPTWKRMWYLVRGLKPPMYDYERFFAENEPYEVLEHEVNTITNLGAQLLWRIFVGLGTSAAPSATNRAAFLSSANAYIGVGDGTAPASATDTNLTGTNKFFKAMDSDYPQAPSFDPTGPRTVTFLSTFGTTEANFAWNEVGLANADLTTNANGILFNRANVSWGTKTSYDTWTVAVMLQVLII
jgi:hypothetical protein